MKRLSIIVVLALALGMVIAACQPVAPAPQPAQEQPAAEAPAEEPAAEEEMAEEEPAAEEEMAEEAAPTEEPAEEEMAAEDLTFVTIVKIAGINWFNRMEEGVLAWGGETGVNATLVGPAEADAAQQIPIIEDLLRKASMPSALSRWTRPSSIRYYKKRWMPGLWSLLTRLRTRRVWTTISKPSIIWPLGPA